MIEAFEKHIDKRISEMRERIRNSKIKKRRNENFWTTYRKSMEKHQ
jgi:hypothetical protein